MSSLNFKDLTGQKFGRLIINSRAPNSKEGRACWNCTCDCGNLIIVCGKHLRLGYTQSCGCLQKERAKQSNTKHGLSHSKLYNIWQLIVQRTTNIKHPRYQDYGGRGIKICDEWRNNPELFIKYCQALPGCDDPKLSLDRIDNDGNYKPGNLRFTTKSIQNSNQRPHSNTCKKYIYFDAQKQLYRVQKYINGKCEFFGRFKTLAEAIDSKIRNNL